MQWPVFLTVRLAALVEACTCIALRVTALAYSPTVCQSDAKGRATSLFCHNLTYFMF